MEIDFETWKKLVEGAQVTKVELRRPNSLYFEFDTGMACYVCSEKPLEFDYNWLKGYEFLSEKALRIHVKRIKENIEAEQAKKQVNEKHWVKRRSKRERV